jgi:hypothetical protein
MDDRAQLAHAAREGRAMVTCDVSISSSRRRRHANAGTPGSSRPVAPSPGRRIAALQGTPRYEGIAGSSYAQAVTGPAFRS